MSEKKQCVFDLPVIAVKDVEGRIIQESQLCDTDVSEKDRTEFKPDVLQICDVSTREQEGLDLSDVWKCKTAKLVPCKSDNFYTGGLTQVI